MCLILAGCIDVEDYGKYWDIAGLDEQLNGVWIEAGLDGDKGKNLGDIPGPDTLDFTPRGNEYKVMEDQSSRSLSIGKCNFLTFPGYMIRYKIAPDGLYFYTAISRLLQEESLRSKLNDMKGIEIKLMDVAGTRIIVKKLDDDSVKTISTICEKDMFWVVVNKYVRQK